MQIFPVLAFDLIVDWFGARALLCGWAVAIIGGSWMAFADGIKLVHTLVVAAIPTRYTPA